MINKDNQNCQGYYEVSGYTTDDGKKVDSYTRRCWKHGSGVTNIGQMTQRQFNKENSLVNYTENKVNNFTKFIENTLHKDFVSDDDINSIKDNFLDIIHTTCNVIEDMSVRKNDLSDKPTMESVELGSEIEKDRRRVYESTSKAIRLITLTKNALNKNFEPVNTTDKDYPQKLQEHINNLNLVDKISKNLMELFNISSSINKNSISKVNKIKEDLDINNITYNGPTGGASNIQNNYQEYNAENPIAQRIYDRIVGIDNKIDKLNEETNELNKVNTVVKKKDVLQKLDDLRKIVELVEKNYPLAEKIDSHKEGQFIKKKDTLVYWFEKVINKLPKTVDNTNRVISKYSYYNGDSIKSVSKLNEDMIEIERLITKATRSKISLITKFCEYIRYHILQIVDNINYKNNPQESEEEIDPRYGKKPKMSPENEAIYDYALEHHYDPSNVEFLENIIKAKEDFKEYAYDDVHPDKILKPGDKIDGYITIGYGFRFINGKEVKAGMHMTRNEADIYLHNYIINNYGKDLSNSLTVPITQNQYAALLSLVYNIGSSNLKEKTIIKLLNSGDYIGARDAFILYNKSKGKVNKGLTDRRKWEQKLFIREIEYLFESNY